MIFRNRVAYALWVFAAVLLLFVAAMTWVAFAGDSGEPDSSTLAGPRYGRVGTVLVWCHRLRLVRGYSAGNEIELAVGGGLRVVQRYPFRTHSRLGPMVAINEVAIVESADDEGDPYFYARIRLSGDGDTDLAEGHDRQRVEDTRDRSYWRSVRPQGADS